MADWANLNHYLLIEIAEKLGSMESYECFGRVCKSWEAAAREGHLNHIIFEGPWLMFAEKYEDNECLIETEREISSVSLGIKRSMKIFLPEVSKKVYLSCKDWLLVTPQGDIDVFLLHPLTRVQIHLPKFTTLQFYYPFGSFGLHFVDKAVLSANPTTTSDFIVMIICGQHRRLAFWRSGDTSWTSIDYWKRDRIFDIIYCNDKLYGIDRHHTIISCDINGPNPTQLVKVFDNLRIDFCDAKSYLVELPGQLPVEKFLIIHKYQEFPGGDINNYYYTKGFKVFEVNIKDGTWVEVKDLGNRSLFLGYNSSFAIECSDFNKCKPNCIYFSEDHVEQYMCRVTFDGDYDDIIRGGKDMGIYHISDGTILPFFDDIVTSKLTPPTWIGPSFLI